MTAPQDRADVTPHEHLSRADRLAAVLADVEERLEREARAGSTTPVRLTAP